MQKIIYSFQKFIKFYSTLKNNIIFFRNKNSFILKTNYCKKKKSNIQSYIEEY
jgi:hypothetical protein